MKRKAEVSESGSKGKLQERPRETRKKRRQQRAERRTASKDANQAEDTTGDRRFLDASFVARWATLKEDCWYRKGKGRITIRRAQTQK